MDALAHSETHQESVIVTFLRLRSTFQLLLPQGSAAVNRAEEFVLRVRDQVRFWAGVSHVKRSEVRFDVRCLSVQCDTVQSIRSTTVPLFYF